MASEITEYLNSKTQELMDDVREKFGVHYGDWVLLVSKLTAEDDGRVSSESKMSHSNSDPLLLRGLVDSGLDRLREGAYPIEDDY